MAKNKYLFAFVLVTSLFFLWALLHNVNPILIPHLKKACRLSDTESSLVDLFVYMAYFLVAIPAGLFMHRFGYKKGIMFGLCLYAVGALLVIPAANERSYIFFLFAFFVIASGATFLETVGNPYIAVLGPKESSEQRLNFAQSFNGVGSFLAPILGGQFILSGIENSPEVLNRMPVTELNTYLQSEADAIKMPYLVIAGVVVLLFILFALTKIPEVIEDGDDLHGPVKFSIKVLRHSHTRWAVIAQFFYVGAQVGVGSFFIRYAQFIDGVNEKNAAFMWGSIAMVGFMFGRFIGTFLMRFIKAPTLLAIYALINVLLLTIALLTNGQVSLYAVVAVPFFMSIMFPTIFALGIKDLGKETKVAASFIVMAIIGGAMAPVAMGLISDATHSIQKAYLIPLLCFGVILYYALKTYKVKPVNH